MQIVLFLTGLFISVSIFNSSSDSSSEDESSSEETELPVIISVFILSVL